MKRTLKLLSLLALLFTLGAPAQLSAEEPEAATQEETTPKKLKREGEEAQKARKAAMKALSEDHPAKEGGEDGQKAAVAPPNKRQLAPSPQASELLPWVEHHGSFRVRADSFHNLDLDTYGTSPVPPPLDNGARGDEAQPYINATDDERIASANMRFRYSPIIHITEDLSVHTITDIFDNLVLGTTPEGLRSGRVDDPATNFGGSEPPLGDTIGTEAIKVRAAWARIDTLFGVLKAGRMPSHWGLGILDNDGGTYSPTRKAMGEPAWNCTDCDRGDYVDRVSFVTREPFYRLFYVGFSWDFVSEGVASYNGLNDTFGQPYDLSQNDDVTQVVLSVFDSPETKKEIDQRHRDMAGLDAIFDWGLKLIYRTQDLKSTAPIDAINQTGADTSVHLYSTDLTAYVADGWLKFFKRFGKDRTLSIGVEVMAAMMAHDRPTLDAEEAEEYMLYGGALEAVAQFKDLYFGFNGGAAGGSDIEISGHPSAGEQSGKNMGFRFDANYQIDLILFNELMGGINNSAYFNPWIAYHFPLDSVGAYDVLGARLDLVSGLALDKDATPSGEYWYGIEADGRLYYEQADRYRVELAAGFLLPGSAWDRVPGSDYPVLPSGEVYDDHRTVQKTYEADWAWTIQTNLTWLF